MYTENVLQRNANHMQCSEKFIEKIYYNGYRNINFTNFISTYKLLYTAELAICIWSKSLCKILNMESLYIIPLYIVYSILYVPYMKIYIIFTIL